MATFVKIDDTNTVTDCILIDDSNCSIDGAVSESVGKEFIASLNLDGKWILSAPGVRNKTASPGDKYNPDKDIFVIDESIFNTNFITPWQTILQPTSPSIMIDAPVRSANQFTAHAVNCLYPQAFQRWGYLYQHNPNTFKETVGLFDVVMTVVRNPLDSVASHIYAGKYETGAEIDKAFNENKKFLDAILEAKNNIEIFTFEEVTQTPEILGTRLSQLLGVEAVPYDHEAVLAEISKLPKIDYYAMPVNNSAELEQIKSDLNARYAEKINESMVTYNAILA